MSDDHANSPRDTESRQTEAAAPERPPKTSDTARAERAKSGSRDENNVLSLLKERYFAPGLLIGTLLVILPALISFSLSERRLLICSGVAIIFGAFGSTAAIKHKVYTLAGSAAVAVILFLVFVKAVEVPYTRGLISGDFKTKTLTIFAGAGSNNFLTAREPDGKHYRFVVFGEIIEAPVVEIAIDDEPLEGSTTDQTETRPILIESAVLNETLSQTKQISIEIKTDENGNLFAVDQASDQRISRRDVTDIASEQKSIGEDGDFLGRIRKSLSFLFPAEANGLCDAPQVLLEDLESDITSVRRDARRELGACGDSALPELLDTYKESKSYRTRLGTLVSLVYMLRNNSSLATGMRKSMTREHLEAVVRDNVNKDPTVRLYAGELLVRLKDERSISFLIDQAEQSSNAAEQKRALLVLKVLKKSNPSSVDKQLNTIRSEIDDENRALFEDVYSGN